MVTIFGAVVLRSKYIVAILDNMKAMYAHPLIGMLSANSAEPIIAPQKEICSIIVFKINSVMKLKEFVEDHMVTHLLNLCKRELNLTEMPEINFVDQPTVSSGSSFGQFQGNTIHVVTKGRHQMDVMRTLAHELVHWKQMCDGEELDGNDGSETENHANATAGIIMRKFGKLYPDYFVDTIP